MTYEIISNTTQTGLGVAFLIHEGQEITAESRKGAILALSREAVKRGVPDGAWRAVRYPGGPTCLYGSSLHGISLWTCHEPEKGRPGFIRYVPDTRFAA